MKPFKFPFTAFHNYILDNIMPKLSGSGWKVLCVAIRQTLGWEDESTESGRKESDIISYSQFGKKTGIKSSSTISKAIKECLGNDYLMRFQVGTHPGTQKPIYSYRLNQEYQAASPENELEQIASPEIGAEQGVASPENGVAASPKNGLTKESKRNYSKETISPNGDEINDPDFPVEEKEPEGDKGYKPGPGKIVSCIDPDTDEEVGEPDWRFPQTQIQHQAFNITGRKRFHSKAEYNKMRKIEYKLDNGELPHEFWEAQKGCAGVFSWNFPVLLKSTLNPDRFRKWQASEIRHEKRKHSNER